MAANDPEHAPDSEHIEALHAIGAADVRYEPPRLIVLGTIEELTGGYTASISDGINSGSTLQTN